MLCTASFPGPIVAQTRTHFSVSPNDRLYLSVDASPRGMDIGTMVLFVCELDGRTGVPLQSRLIASRFLMPFPIGCNDSISNVAAQEALPSIRAVTGAFGIFRLNEHHEAVTTKAGHLAPPFKERGQWLVPWHINT